MTINATVYREPDGRWTAELPSFPGCASSGETRAEALSNLQEAALLYFEDDAVEHEMSTTRELVTI
jgi:predicted RNase H-like HicB family nuclease